VMYDLGYLGVEHICFLQTEFSASVCQVCIISRSTIAQKKDFGRSHLEAAGARP